MASWTVSGASGGFTAYNGTYDENGTYGGKARYSKGAYDIYWDSAYSLWCVGSAGSTVYWVALGGATLPANPWAAQVPSDDITVSGAGATSYAATGSASSTAGASGAANKRSPAVGACAIVSGASGAADYQGPNLLAAQVGANIVLGWS